MCFYECHELYLWVTVSCNTSCLGTTIDVWDYFTLMEHYYIKNNFDNNFNAHTEWHFKVCEPFRIFSFCIHYLSYTIKTKKKSYLFFNSVCICKSDPILNVCVWSHVFSSWCDSFCSKNSFNLYFGWRPCMNCLRQVLPKHFKIKVMTSTFIPNKNIF